MIEKLNLKTPGREDDEETIDLQANAAAVKAEMKRRQGQGKAGDQEKAEAIIAGLGGRGNILTIDNCFSRLRVEVRDISAINEAALKETGAAGIVKKGTNVQVVYGLGINKIRTIVDDALGNHQ